MPQPARYSNFGGGINNNAPADQINDNEVVDALNVIFDKRYNFVTRGGLSKVNSNKNLAFRTEDIDEWGDVGPVVVTPNDAVAPDGSTTADKVETLSGGGVVFNHTISSIANDAEYTISIFLKKGIGGSHIPGLGVFLYDSGAVYADPISYGVVFNNVDLDLPAGKIVLPIDITDGTTYAGIPTTFTPVVPTHIQMIDVDENWLRISFRFVNNVAGNNLVRIIFYPALSPRFASPVAQEGSGSQYIWGSQVELGFLSDYHKNILDSNTPNPSVHFVRDKFTSILDYRNSDGTSALIVTAGDDIFRLNQYDFFETIWGGMINELPDDTYWQWIMYDNMAIGVNRANTASGKKNPIKIESATIDAVALTGTPPKGNYIAVWNDRIWIADADNSNVVKCSSLGLPENWTNVGKAGSQSFEVGDEEASPITGLIAHKDRLFIFKPDKTYYIAPGSPNTDIEQYEIILLSGSIGCISGYSIQSVIDDVVFLSRQGLTSLSSVEQFGNFAESVISKNVKELNDFTFDDINTASVINPYESQYWIAAPLGGGIIHNGLYLMDYTGLQEKIVGFTRFTGRILGATFSSVFYLGKKRIYIGGYPQAEDGGIAYVYRYEPDRYNDDGFFYKSSITTKAYNLGDAFLSKIIHRIFGVFEILTEMCSIGITYLFDENKSKQKYFIKIFEGLVFVGGKWGDKWGSMIWASRESLERRVKRKLIGPPGRLCKSIQFIITTINKDEAMITKDIGFDYDVASFHKES